MDNRQSKLAGMIATLDTFFIDIIYEFHIGYVASEQIMLIVSIILLIFI